jgi:RHS repeat-associated protein
VPSAVDILGVAPASASVTVNSSPADYRRGEYFQELVTVANGANPVWQAISVTTLGGGSASGNVFVPRTPEDFDDPATPSVNEGYDLDGNQLRDGRWSYTWDGENRLVKLESLASAPTGSKRRLEFEYDWQGRRIKKKVTNLDTSSVLLDNKFLYDGWNLIAGLNATNNAVIRFYIWGLDLSGSIQGAGGVGGLLAVNDTANGVHFAAYDGNGNVTALVKAADGTISAQYEYGPFAEPIRVTGPMGKTNPIRFSTKYTDDESDFLYYGLRYYNPSTGRWLNRDPIGEAGGMNMYVCVFNDLQNYLDLLGLDGTSISFIASKVWVCKISMHFELINWIEFFSYPKGFGQWKNQPPRTHYVNTSSQMIEIVQSRIPKYDPEGKCCLGKCIENLTISSHGAGSGNIPLETDRLTYHWFVKQYASMTTESLPKGLQNYVDEYKRAKYVLSFFKSYMCRGGKIIFVVCAAGKGPAGKTLNEQLREIFGPEITVITYER